MNLEGSLRTEIHEALDAISSPTPELTPGIVQRLRRVSRQRPFLAMGQVAAVLGIGLIVGAVVFSLHRSRVTPATVTTSPSASQDPCAGFMCDGPGARLNAAYPYRLSTHCGVLATRFDGRPFYVEAVDPATVTTGLNNPEDFGTMTLVSPHVAVFVTSRGHAIRFVDSPPGVVGQSYPFRVLVLSGGNQLIDRPFAGRLWRAQGSLPGVIGPPYGNGQDRFTEVNGTITLTSPDDALFRSAAGAQVRFVAVQPGGCD